MLGERHVTLKHGRTESGPYPKTNMTNEAIQRFPVGTLFIPIGRKHDKPHVVTDFLVTRNLAGEVVRREYKTEHEFCGQTVSSFVPEATIARGLLTPS